jgi:hypothetical protein
MASLRTVSWRLACIGAATGLVAVAVLATAPGALPQTRMLQRMELPCEAETGLITECVRPSETDPAIRRFDEPSYILASARTGPDAQLMLFMTGTGGEPPGPRTFLAAAANAGYRVISLAYNDRPAVVAYCPRNPDPSCSENFRRMRLYGDRTLGDGAIDSTPPESIVNRLVKLLQYLDRRHPDGGWAGYLDNGAPNWRRIVVCGQSQGAGMAAFIAKEHEVARVILFSSPWDFINTGGERKLASWLAAPSKTPPDRWFGGYHARETMADLMAQSYPALKIPPAHIRIFNADLPQGSQPRGNNSFHGQGIHNPAYSQDWAFFLRG